MTKGKAFILVGHENWGKSEKLKHLTDGNTHIRSILISDKLIYIKRMSNDDVPNGPDALLNFLEQRKNDLFIIILYAQILLIKIERLFLF